MFQKEYKIVNQYTNFDLNTVNVVKLPASMVKK